MRRGLIDRLSGAEVTYEGIGWQRFLVSGRMIYRGAEAPSGSASPGEWRVEDDSLCSRWQPGGEWECYRVEIDGQGGVRFIDAYGNISAGRFSRPILRRIWTSDHAGGTGGALDAHAADRRPARGSDGSAHGNLSLAARCRRIGAGGDRHASLRLCPADPGRTPLSLAGCGRRGWPFSSRTGGPFTTLPPGGSAPGTTVRQILMMLPMCLTEASLFQQLGASQGPARTSSSTALTRVPRRRRHPACQPFSGRAPCAGHASP